MSDVARNHVDFIGIRHRNQHVGVGDAGAFENIGMGGISDEALNIESIDELLNQLARYVDDGDIIVFAGKIACNVETDLAGAANDDLHATLPLAGLLDRSSHPPLLQSIGS